MGLIINKAVILNTGQNLAVGWYINCKSPFRDGYSGDITNMPIKVYKSKADKDAGKKPLFIDRKDLESSFSDNITVAEINTSGWFTAYYDKLKVKLSDSNNLEFIESDIANEI